MNPQLFNEEQEYKYSFIYFTVIVVLFSMTLRTPITVVGPSISIIRNNLGISYTLGGFLTTIPLLAFAVVSPFAPRTARKFGMEQTLFYSLIIITIGMILRSLGSTTMLLIGTILIGVGIAFGNVLIPSFFKLHFPLKIGLFTGIFTLSMNISAGLAMGISLPIATTSFDWKGALAFPLIFVILALIIWLPLLRRKKVELTTSPKKKQVVQKKFKLLTSPLAWAITFTMGLQSLIFYCSIAWFPEILISQGFTDKQAGWFTSLMTYAQIPMTFMIPIIAEKFRTQTSIVLLFSSMYILGFIGIIFKWTSFISIWMILIGLAGGASFSLTLMFFSLRTKTAYEVAQLSGFAQSIGYLFAAVGPILFGYLHDVTNSWNIPSILFLLSSIVLCIFALFSAQKRYV